MIRIVNVSPNEHNNKYHNITYYQIDVHGSSISGQKAKYEARRIRVNFIYDEQHARARGRHRDRERQQVGTVCVIYFYTKTGVN